MLKAECSPLEDVAKVITGLSGHAVAPYRADFDTKIRPLKLLKGNGLNHDGDIVLSEAELVFPERVNNLDRYLLRAGDVILLTRGSRIRAGFVTDLIAKESVVVSSNFVVVRPDPSLLLGEVLVAYFNSEIGLQNLNQRTVGAVIGHLPASQLRALEVPVPPIPSQEKIKVAYHAAKEAYQATQTLAQQQKRAMEAHLMHLMVGSEAC